MPITYSFISIFTGDKANEIYYLIDDFHEKFTLQ